MCDYLLNLTVFVSNLYCVCCIYNTIQVIFTLLAIKKLVGQILCVELMRSAPNLLPIDRHRIRDREIGFDI